MSTDLFHTYGYSLIFYNWEPVSHNGLLRYASTFTEPGNYAAYLSLAFAWSLIYQSKFFSIRNLFFIVGLILTFSTAGYFSFYFIITFYLLSNKRISIQKIILFILSGFIMIWSFNNMEYLCLLML